MGYGISSGRSSQGRYIEDNKGYLCLAACIGTLAMSWIVSRPFQYAEKRYLSLQRVSFNNFPAQCSGLYLRTRLSRK
jgi:hypothetical protein